MRNLKINTAIFISSLTALLFIYAATSKLLDFQNFRIQLGQSPLLSAFADWVAIFVPLLEFIIAIALFIQRIRFIALLSAFILMVMFTAYIYIILNFSAFVPCSCGGILEKMTWRQHLVFNIAFTALLALAVLSIPITSKTSRYEN